MKTFNMSFIHMCLWKIYQLFHNVNTNKGKSLAFMLHVSGSGIMLQNFILKQCRACAYEKDKLFFFVECFAVILREV